MINRVELLIYFNYRSSSIDYFKEIGLTVEYFNKKMGCAVCYMDEENSNKIFEALKRMKGFKKYEISQSELVKFNTK